MVYISDALDKTYAWEFSQTLASVWACGEWDHFIYFESAYQTILTLNCPRCNGRCVPKRNGIDRVTNWLYKQPETIIKYIN